MAKKRKRQISRRSIQPSATKDTEFNPDYSAVKKDLKTIGTLASFFIIALVVLSFFLR
jgi:hypothetical protein